jgi:hypothetical protein
MIRTFLSSLVFLIHSAFAFAQKDKIGTDLSEAYQLDSSEYFMIPQLLNETTKEVYGKGKGIVPWTSYTEVILYNSSTNQSKKVFQGMKVLVAPFFATTRYYYSMEKPKEAPENFLDNHIVYLVRSENYNSDSGLDTADPLYLYISDRSGGNVARITPVGHNVLSWSLSKDKKFILARVQTDRDGNKKFNEKDDEVYYRIDLDKDISKIKCYPIPL